MPDTESIQYLYGDITKVDAAEHIVEGFISSDQVDLGGHIIDPEFLKTVLPSWVARWGNVREMHSPLRAVGTVQEADLTKAEGPFVRAKIVDEDTWGRITSGVLKGFSVGIKNPIVIKDPVAPKGRCVGGDFLELSVVDRPANGSARFTLFKAAASGNGVVDVQHGVVVEPDAAAVPELDSVKPKENVVQTTEPTALFGPTEADLAKAATAKSSITHPFKGVHNHPHDSHSGGTHTHAHLHDEDDVHDHPHLNGKDARMLSPEERSQAKEMHRSASMYMTPVADLGATSPDVAKASPDFASVERAIAGSPVVDRLAVLQMQMKDIRAEMDRLAGQTDEDKDGDVDFSARKSGDDEKVAAGDFTTNTARTPTVISPEPLQMGINNTAAADIGATVPELVKSISAIIDQKVEERFAVLKNELRPGTEVSDIAGVTSDIAKYAQGIAKGLGDLAASSGAMSQQLTESRAEAARLSEDLERVKRIAQPVRGQSATVVEKTIGIDTGSETAPDLAKSATSPDGLATLAEKAKNIKDEGSRKALAEEVYKIMTSRQTAR